MGLYQFSNGRCFLGIHLAWCVWYNPFPFINQSIRAQRALEFKVKHNAQRSWWPSQSSVLGVILSISVLPGNLGHASRVLALIYPTWLTRGALLLPWASPVHSAERDASRSDSDLLVGKSSFGIVRLYVGYVRSVGSSECLHEMEWTQGQVLSTKYEYSFFPPCSSLHLNINSLLPLADCALAHWIFS